MVINRFLASVKYVIWAKKSFVTSFVCMWKVKERRRVETRLSLSPSVSNRTQNTTTNQIYDLLGLSSPVRCSPVSYAGDWVQLIYNHMHQHCVTNNHLLFFNVFKIASSLLWCMCRISDPAYFFYQLTLTRCDPYFNFKLDTLVYVHVAFTVAKM